MSNVSEAAKQSLKGKLFKNFSVEFVARLYYLITRFLLTPITLSYVTLQEYGIWAACFILMSYMGMSSMGIANVYIRYIAQHNARGEQDKINKLISTGLALTSTISIVLMAVLAACLPSALRFLKTPPALSHKASVLILVTAGTFMLDLCFGVFSNALAALQKNAQTSLVWAFTVTLEVLVAVSLLRSGHGIYSLAWAFAARYIVSTVVLAICCYRSMPGLSIRLSEVDREMMRLFLGYGSVVQISGLICTFLYSIEKVTAGIFIGVEATGLFDVGEKLPIMGSQLASSMNSIFMPALAHMNTLYWGEEMKKFYIKGARYMTMMTGTMLGFMAAFAVPLLRLWIGPADKFRAAIPILIIFCLPYQTHVMTGPGSAYHRGAGKPARELVYPLTQLALVLLFVSLGFAMFGKTTVVIAVAVAAAMVFSGIFYMGYTHRILDIPNYYFFKQVFFPGLIPYFLGFAAAPLFAPLFAWAGESRPLLAIAICAAGLFHVSVVAAVLYRLVCPWGEREYLRKQALHSLGGFWRPQATTSTR